MLTSTALSDASTQNPTLQSLVKFFWHGAQLLAKHVSFEGYKAHLFALIVYKRFCDIDAEGQLTRPVAGLGASDAQRDQQPYPIIPQGYSWRDVLQLQGGYGAALGRNIRAFAQHNDRLVSTRSVAVLVFETKSLFPDEVLRELLLWLDSRRLGRSDVDDSIFVQAMELLVGRLADQEKQGQAQRPSPRGIARLMVELVNPDRGMRVYDPVCGTAGLLLECVRHMERTRRDPASLVLFGQEKSADNVVISNLLLACSEAGHASIKLGDSLRSPQFLDSPDSLARFDIVLGNPPFSLPNWCEDGEWHPDRFRRDRYGLPHRSFGDYAFVLHMLASLNNEGRMAVVLPIGALYRSGPELSIRRGLLEDGLVEAAIVLGPGLFAKTNVSVCVLLFRCGRAEIQSRHVLMIDGAQEHVRGRPNHLSDHNVQRLVGAVLSYTDVPGFCRVVPMDEIERNHWDLRASRYCGPVPLTRPSEDTVIVQPNDGSVHGKIFESAQGAPSLTDDGYSTIEAIDAALAAQNEALERAHQLYASSALSIWTGGTGLVQLHPAFGKIPVRCRLVKLHEMLFADGLRNGMSKPLGEPGECYLFLGQDSLTESGEVDLSRARRSTAKDAHAPFILRHGDVLVKRANGSKCGQAGYVDLSENQAAVFASGLIRIRIEPTKLDPLLLASWLNHPPVHRALKARANGSVLPSISHPVLRDFPCPLLEPDEHQEARRVLWACRDRIAILGAQRERLLKMRLALLSSFQS